MREDGAAGPVEFDNMQQRQVNGTRGWTEYSITLPLRAEARTLVVGVLVAGTGTVWADDLRLLVDGKPVWEAPKVQRPETAIELDHEFDAGSGIVISQLSQVQIANLATLGKVWGFLKYHHAVVTAGKRHWDYELFRVMPTVLAARDRDTANAALRDWIRSLGEIAPCNPCVTPRLDDLHLRPDVDWIAQERALGSELARLLRTTYLSRTSASQFYVSLAPKHCAIVYDQNLRMTTSDFPTRGYRLLALFEVLERCQYWYPDPQRGGAELERRVDRFIRARRPARSTARRGTRLDEPRLDRRKSPTRTRVHSPPSCHRLHIAEARCTTVRVGVRRKAQVMTVTHRGCSLAGLKSRNELVSTHDLPGDTFRSGTDTDSVPEPRQANS